MIPGPNLSSRLSVTMTKTAKVILHLILNFQFNIEIFMWWKVQCLLPDFCKLLRSSGSKSSSYHTFDVTGIELLLACPFPRSVPIQVWYLVLHKYLALGLYETLTQGMCVCEHLEFWRDRDFILPYSQFYCPFSVFSNPSPFISAASSLRCHPY